MPLSYKLCLRQCHICVMLCVLQCTLAFWAESAKLNYLKATRNETFKDV